MSAPRPPRIHARLPMSTDPRVSGPGDASIRATGRCA